MASLTFDELRAVNAQRCARWHPGFPGRDAVGWTGGDWSNAMLGEVGEVAEVFALLVAAAGNAGNTVKKLRRAECGSRGVLDAPPEGLREKLADELADALTYADLLAAYYGIDLGAAIASKFNRVSELQGFPERLS